MHHLAMRLTLICMGRHHGAAGYQTISRFIYLCIGDLRITPLFDKVFGIHRQQYKRSFSLHICIYRHKSYIIQVIYVSYLPQTWCDDDISTCECAGGCV